MTGTRTYALAAAAIAAIAAVLVAASVASGTAPKRHVTPKVSGTISIISEATGAEQEHFKNVLADFEKLNPDIETKYTSAGRNLTTILSTAVEGGNPPDMALLPQPGFMRELVKKKALKPIEFLRPTIKKNWSAGWVALGSVGGKLYGLYLKGANKSTIWYNVKLFKKAGVKSPKTFNALLKAAKTLKASGTKAYSIGGGDGWTLTDLFENIYLRQAGGSNYDKLSAHKIKWTHPSVKAALQQMGKIFSDESNIAGGTSGALSTVFADSVTQAFGNNPKAAMVLEADFVEGVITGSTNAKPKTDFNYFPWPAIKPGTLTNVVAGGDAVVMFRDKPATRALMKYFATPRAANVYAKQGGFSSPNKQVKGSAYHDPIARRAALALSHAKVVRFDMSDLQPAAFGGTPGQGMWKLFQDLLKNPKNVNQIASQLESAAAKAYSGGK
jgi:alpha-glucoside transport system substrate-binding protein